MADLIDVDAAAGLFGESTFEQVGDSAGELDVLESASHFAQGVGNGLAMLGRDRFRNLTSMGIHQLAQLEHDFGAAREGRGSPLDEGSLGDLDGVVNVRGAGEIDFGLSLAGGGIPDDAGAS